MGRLKKAYLPRKEKAFFFVKGFFAFLTTKEKDLDKSSYFFLKNSFLFDNALANSAMH